MKTKLFRVLFGLACIAWAIIGMTSCSSVSVCETYKGSYGTIAPNHAKLKKQAAKAKQKAFIARRVN